ncbi:small T antigen [Philantomba monticola polyomavirus 1]|uniref:Small T antigen n=1 Tax=Philantomba monticola polyomavirus 1 TaxID=2170411 RepID=A0A2S1CJJ4_9POLY|nr:small T antigen [Philantomba monticola polyomavirus 1]AWD33739.1 small T antigen [Philantomba monticola polyomavirus 1]
MDRLLQKEEKALLIKLLGISPTSFGNIPLMRDAYKRASKKYHPDKGGEGVEMTLLNSLWQRFQEGLLELRNPEVCVAWFSDLLDITLIDVCGYTKFNNQFLRVPACLMPGQSTCCCITSQLLTQHALAKKSGQRCQVWGQCFCYYCFCIWYGFKHCNNSIEWWKFTVGNTSNMILKIQTGLF